MSQNVQVLRVDREDRVESGSVCFEYSDGRQDWNGLFLRGDNSFGLALSIQTVVKAFNELSKDKPLDMMVYMALKDIAGLADLIHEEVVVGGKSQCLSEQVDHHQIDRKIKEAGV